jgi:hypothetical protein
VINALFNTLSHGEEASMPERDKASKLTQRGELLPNGGLDRFLT